MWPFKKRTPNPFTPFVHSDDKALFLVIKTARHGDVVKMRLSYSSDFSANDGDYYSQKMAVSSQNFDRATVEVWLKHGFKVSDIKVDKGQLVPKSEWPKE